MRKTPSPLRAALSAAMLAPVIAVSFAALHSAPAHAQAIIIAPSAPPPARVEAPPPARAGYAWDPGHWRWAHGGYVWAPGHWRPVRAGYRWIPGHWVQRGPNWRWVEGHWA
ncbi:YXWGXW repeat protein [Caballeronia pedi]|uniref:YXWGXW repeat protein n=2 Tax=Caballeronia pedi TaxID=1777141 RepID=A0A158AD82_9BURK|nr:YXWGXW repeat protein [Caballeronia pedi]